ncbi:hypothetical protein ABAZ39_32605 (plasmid) [Azospirillum argentinense]|uniref:Uncharacterized protein n=1 Tax=Azospirillum argentinense TaxID=2970906 RepID=A0A060DUY0_9PROT|nr:hypothetical protein ABAZ39_32605 [Azospirillum argentinense]EZQ02975.1 hypothetical protein ABAZ39_31825 [Azospirillum argentinense]
MTVLFPVPPVTVLLPVPPVTVLFPEPPVTVGGRVVSEVVSSGVSGCSGDALPPEPDEPEPDDPDGGGGGVVGKGTDSILAQAAVTAAELTMPAFCWRCTALCIAMPSVSTITASSMANDCAGDCPVRSVTMSDVASITWVFTVPSSLMILRFPW